MKLLQYITEKPLIISLEIHYIKKDLEEFEEKFEVIRGKKRLRT